MRMLTFSKRCAREILRDPINLFFGLGFPIVLLLLLSAIQSNVPVDIFMIESLAPGVAVFGRNNCKKHDPNFVCLPRQYLP